VAPLLMSISPRDLHAQLTTGHRAAGEPCHIAAGMESRLTNLLMQTISPE